MKPKLSIITINFNTEDYLDKCLASIYSHYKKELSSNEYEVIIVDNASDKDPEKLLGEKYPEVTFLKQKHNGGFSQANNAGIQKSHGDYVLLLNPDTVIVDKNTMPSMLAFMDENTKAGIATCRVELASGELDDASHRGFPTPWRAFTHFSGLSKISPNSTVFNGYHLGYQKMDQTHEIDACAGAFMLVRREIGEKLGWLDEDYFWYGEDLDFCYRTKQRGWKVFFVPGTKITHYKGVASGIKKHSEHISPATRSTKSKATKARFDVMRIFYDKHYKDTYPFFIRWVVLIGIKMKYQTTKLFL